MPYPEILPPELMPAPPAKPAPPTPPRPYRSYRGAREILPPPEEGGQVAYPAMDLGALVSALMGVRGGAVRPKVKPRPELLVEALQRAPGRG